MNETIIGTCSICGGPVVVPAIIWSVVPPTPRCRDCGARMKRSFGRVIPMEPRPHRKNDFYKWEYDRKGPEDDPKWNDDDVWGI